MADLTTNHNFSKPTVGGDRDAWGALLNANWDALDALLATDASGLFLPLAGGTLTGPVTFNDTTQFNDSATFNTKPTLDQGATINGAADGTAVQSSPTDDDTSKLQKVGGFGVGGRAVAYTGDVDDPAIPGGMYFVESSSTGTKPFGAAYGALYVLRRGPGDRASQIWHFDSNRVFTRTYHSGAWQDWVELLDNAHLTEDALDGADGKIARFFTTGGIFGLGTPSPSTLTDLNDASTPAGFYRATNATAGTLPTYNAGLNTASAFAYVLVERYDTNNIRQTYTTVGAGGDGEGRKWTRAWNHASGQWMPWREMYTNFSVVGAVGHDGTDPNGAVIEIGTNANGWSLRLADGTQICWRNMKSDISAAKTWTFPKPFNDAFCMVQATLRNDVKCLVNCTNPSNVDVDFSVWDLNGNRPAAQYDVSLLAIGRWR